MLSGIPPTGELAPRLDTRYTGVYFGEGLGGYSVVDTKVAEQEATSTGSTKATTYQGLAGVKVSSFLRKAALALRFGDWNLLVSGQVTNESRVIYVRDVVQRVKTIAPFLKFDSDPYPVVVGGRIKWVIDAYTTTNDYPYSQSLHPQEPAGSGLDTDFNYVRNSVKATVDAYDGTVHFYVVDPTDPIIKTYRKAFPELFKDVSAMDARPARAHAVPGGHLQRADRAVRAVPHHRSGAVLQQAGDLGHRTESRRVERGSGGQRGRGGQQRWA